MSGLPPKDCSHRKKPATRPNSKCNPIARLPESPGPGIPKAPLGTRASRPRRWERGRPALDAGNEGVPPSTLGARASRPRRWERGRPALDEGKMPSFPGGFLDCLPVRQRFSGKRAEPVSVKPACLRNIPSWRAEAPLGRAARRLPQLRQFSGRARIAELTTVSRGRRPR